MIMMLESVIFGLAEWYAMTTNYLGFRDSNWYLAHVCRETTIEEAVDCNSTYGPRHHGARTSSSLSSVEDVPNHSTLNPRSLDKNSFERFGS